MDSTHAALYAAAATIGFVHTITGPDHYLPFIAMAKARGWALGKTILITVICGVGHVLSSVLLGVAGLALGIAVFKLESIEAFRGDIAGWMLLIFGVMYFAWGVRRAMRSAVNADHKHGGDHEAEASEAHEHSHLFFKHSHPHTEPHSHEAPSPKANITPWILFTIFLFGPCEPLIPILMYPAAEGSLLHVAGVTAVFGVITIATMTAVVVAVHQGLGRIRLPRLARYGHALAGFVIIVCGAAIKAGL